MKHIPLLSIILAFTVMEFFLFLYEITMIYFIEFMVIIEIISVILYFIIYWKIRNRFKPSMNPTKGDSEELDSEIQRICQYCGSHIGEELSEYCKYCGALQKINFYIE